MLCGGCDSESTWNTYIDFQATQQQYKYYTIVTYYVIDVHADVINGAKKKTVNKCILYRANEGRMSNRSPCASTHTRIQYYYSSAYSVHVLKSLYIRYTYLFSRRHWRRRGQEYRTGCRHRAARRCTVQGGPRGLIKKLKINTQCYWCTRMDSYDIICIWKHIRAYRYLYIPVVFR